MSTDGELLQRYVTDHSEAAFAELVRRHLGLVYSTALRRLNGDAHLAQDVAQTVFTALARKAGDLADRPALAGWLYLGAHLAAAQAIRSDRRRQTYEQEAQAMQQLHASSDVSSSSSATDWDSVRPVLDDALRELGEADREAVLLRFFQQRPFADIGAALDLSEDAARMRVDRALDKLHALLGRRGITSTTAALATAFANQAMVAAPAGMAASVTGAALSGATAITGGTAAAAGAIIFMSKTTTTIISVAALALALFGYREFTSRRTAEATNAATQTELARLRAEVTEARRRLAAADQASAALRRDAETARSANLSPAPAPVAVEPQPAQPQVTLVVGRGRPADQSAGDTPPQIASLLAEALQQNYAPLYRQLGLTSEQQEKFTAISVASKVRANELFRAAIANGIKPSNDLNRQIVVEQTNPELEAKLRETFGDGVVQAFQRFEAQAPLRSTTTQLASTLFQSGAPPLSTLQGDQLVAIMAANVAPTPEGKAAVLALDVPAVIAQARGVLTPEQVLPFQRMLENGQAAPRAR